MPKKLSARIQDHFAPLTDPRRRKVIYPLINVVTIAICAVICGADDFVAVADYGRKKRKWLAVQGVTDRDRLPGRWESHRPEDVRLEEGCLRSEAVRSDFGDHSAEHGLKRLPAVLEEFVVGDVDDLFESIKEFAVMLKGGNEAIVKELDGTFERMRTSS